MAKTLKLNQEETRAIEEAAFSAIEPILASEFFLLDISMEQESGRWYLRVYIDKAEDTVSLDDCEAISIAAEKKLDNLAILNQINTAYVLEVSSPGLFRTLTKAREFEYYKGQPVRVTTMPGVKATLPISTGIIESYDADSQTAFIKAEQESPIPVVLSEKQFSIQLNPSIDIPDE